MAHTGPMSAFFDPSLPLATAAMSDTERFADASMTRAKFGWSAIPSVSLNVRF